MKSFYIFTMIERNNWTFSVYKQKENELLPYSFVVYMTKEEAEEELIKLNRGKYE